MPHISALQRRQPDREWSDGPRERLLNLGAQCLSNAELLAILLRTGSPGMPVCASARQLLQNLGTLNVLLTERPAALLRIPGLGPAKVASLLAAMELAIRVRQEALTQRPVLSAPELVFDFLALTLRARDREAFLVLYLNQAMQLLHHEILFTGTVNQTVVYPREVVRHALLHNATGLIVAHNHPSGNPEPSEADHTLTSGLARALALVSITLVDHVIVSGPQTWSYREHGQLPPHRSDRVSPTGI